MLTRAISPLPADVEECVHRTIGCALEVHRQIGAGYLETIYHKALRIELERQGLKYQSERPVVVSYRGTALHTHRIDLVVENRVIVEVKAVQRFERVHQSQLLSYLKATRLRVGLLINFNTDWLKGNIRRIVL
jgi:GxxExxY protein